MIVYGFGLGRRKDPEGSSIEAREAGDDVRDKRGDALRSGAVSDGGERGERLRAEKQDRWEVAACGSGAARAMAILHDDWIACELRGKVAGL